MSSLFQVAGVSSGIAWDDIINKLLENGRKPATQWQNQIDKLEVKKTLYQQMQSNFNKLRNTLTPLRLANAYTAKKAEYTSFSNNNVNPENIVTAKVGADAELTWWDIDVKQLARAQRHTTTRFDSVSEALGISGQFRIRVGQQMAIINVNAGDTLRDINYNISKATDQDGRPIAVTAKLLDNRIVLESAAQGKNSSGDTGGVSFTMNPWNNEYYLPHSSVRDESGKYVYPPQIFQLCYTAPSNVADVTYTYNYTEGVDFSYDASIGKITWLGGTGARRPPAGATVRAIYSDWRSTITTGPSGPTGEFPLARTNVFIDPKDPAKSREIRLVDPDCDILPFLPTGGKYDLANTTFEIVAGGKDYVQGMDFELAEVYGDDDELYQVIRWLVDDIDLPDPPGGTYTPARPIPPNDKYTIRIGANNEYRFDENVFHLEPVNIAEARNLVHGDKPDSSYPTLPPGFDYLPPNIASAEGKIEITGVNNIRYYIEGEDEDFIIIKDYEIEGTKYDVIKWLIDIPPDDLLPEEKMANDLFGFNIRRVQEGDYSENSVLAKLGFITPDPHNNDKWKFTEGTYAEASDAIFMIDGVEVTRYSNTIEDVIAHVSLELRGLGQVRINIVRDLEKTVEEIQTFVDEYNATMEWINFYVSQKEDGANPVDETDHLSSILQQSRGNTVYGVLHGDELLWSIKNQLRLRLSNAISSISTSLTSRKVAQTDSAMNVRSSFHVYSGGKVAMITIEPSDSMEVIRNKIANAYNIASTRGPNSQWGRPLDLNVTIRDGQLVIDGPRNSSLYASGERDTIGETLIRSDGTSEDLTFVPFMELPISGEMMVFSGRNPFTEGESTLYQEGTDYRVVTSTDNNTGIMFSSIEWIDGRGPKQPTGSGSGIRPGESYHVTYSYYPSAVTAVEIPGTGPRAGEVAQGINDFSYLELRQDSSKTMMSAFGITTESMNYGKSGLLEFDSEKFLTMMENDPDLSANAMLTFMRDFDAYIGNLVDSSQILVAGQPVTKGRIAVALQGIDNQQQTLNDRITKLDKDLQAKQTALYKQYSDMEVAIQRLNAQMYSVMNYLNSMGSGNS